MKEQKLRELTLEFSVWQSKIEFLGEFEELIKKNASGYELEDSIGVFMQLEVNYVKETYEKEKCYHKGPISVYNYIYLPKILDFCVDLGANRILEKGDRNQLDEILRLIKRNRIIAECRFHFINKKLKIQSNRII